MCCEISQAFGFEHPGCILAQNPQARVNVSVVQAQINAITRQIQKLEANIVDPRPAMFRKWTTMQAQIIALQQQRRLLMGQLGL